MGILDSLSSALQGQTGGQTGSAPSGANPGANTAAALVSHALSVIESQPGGLAGLVQNFQQNGLGHVIQSWIGTGQNLPISPSQIQATLGSAATSRIAQATGLPQAEVESHLSTLLPQLIDHLTPNGQLPQGDLRAALANVAQRFLRG